jgi:hypothetical protein
MSDYKLDRDVAPSIADLRRQGVLGVRLFCSAIHCGHYAVVPFVRINAPESTPFPSLRFKCSKCNGRDIHAMPDWPRPSDGITLSWGVTVRSR